MKNTKRFTQSMKSGLCALAIGLTACGPSEAVIPSDEAGAAGRDIVGGTVTTAYPAVVSLNLRTAQGRQGYCSGTLVRPSVVLTAAHCLAYFSPELIEVGFQGANDTAPTRFIRVREVSVSSEYSELSALTLLPDDATDRETLDTPTSDFGLLMLAEPVTDVQPVELVSAWPYEGSPVTLVGYGVPEKSGAFGTKRVTAATITSIGDAQFMIESKEHNSCFGDSGGPALKAQNGKPTVVGVASWGDGECKRYGVWASTSRALTRLTSTIARLEAGARLPVKPLRAIGAPSYFSFVAPQTVDTSALPGGKLPENGALTVNAPQGATALWASLKGSQAEGEGYFGPLPYTSAGAWVYGRDVFRIEPTFDVTSAYVSPVDRDGKLPINGNKLRVEATALGSFGAAGLKYRALPSALTALQVTAINTLLTYDLKSLVPVSGAMGLVGHFGIVGPANHSASLIDCTSQKPYAFVSTGSLGYGSTEMLLPVAYDTANVCVSASSTEVTPFVMVNGGFFATADGGAFTATHPERVLSVRQGIGEISTGGRPLGTGNIVAADLKAAGLPADASAVMVVSRVYNLQNMAGTSPDGELLLTACEGWAQGTLGALSRVGQEGYRLSVVPLGPSGKLCATTSMSGELDVTVIGFFSGPTTVAALPTLPATQAQADGDAASHALRSLIHGRLPGDMPKRQPTR